MRSGKRSKLSLLVLLLLLVISWVSYLHRYSIYDWYRLIGYDPPSEIVALADQTSMSEYGRRLFYVNRPVLNDKSSFQEKCTIDEATIVLGCYISGDGIYLYKVTDERLKGVHQVTAAHEMLHAAYSRLSSAEKEKIDALTAKVASSITNERINNTINNYKTRDPSVVPNELHSILATEVSELPEDLEAYYSKYFTDRSAIVNYSKQYESVFEERRNQVESYDAQLSSLKQSIDSKQVELNSISTQIQADRTKLDALLASNNISAYNAQVPVFNSLVRSYNSLVNEVRGLIDQYNAVVKLRNDVVLEENELLEAIDSRPDTLPAH